MTGYNQTPEFRVLEYWVGPLTAIFYVAHKAGVAHIDIDPSMSLPVKIVKGMCLNHHFNRIHPSIDTFFVVVLL